MRISGLASGMDIDAIVKELMAAERKPLEKLTQKKQTTEWQRSDYQDIAIKLVDFRNNKLSAYNRTNVMAAKSATVTGENVVTAKATSSALNGSMTIKVNRLAEAASVYSSSSIGTGLTGNEKLADVMTFSDSTITINGEPITLAADETINSLVNKINRNSNMKVTAFFDAQSGQLSLMNKETGAGNVSLAGDLLTGEDGFDLNSFTPGQDASVEVNGMTITRSSNKFSVSGVELTLTGVTASTATTLSVGTDATAIVDTIKSFIKDYNELLDLVNGKLNEERYRNYAPLSDEQKEEMTEDQIKMWEEKAKSGLLRNDLTLQSLVTNLRMSAITDVGTGADAINLTSLGITTGKWEDRGKLVIEDEEKLIAAIEANPDQVLNLFTANGSENKPTSSDEGIFNRMSNVAMEALTALSEKAGTSRFSTDKNITLLADSTIGRELSSLDKRIADMEARMVRKETQYFKQFTAMETAISKYNSVSSSLFSFFS